MLKNKITLQEQECEGSYDFHCKTSCTKGFLELFGDESLELTEVTLCLINNKYKNPDWMQVIYYGDKKFYVIAEYERNVMKETDSDKKNYVTFMLPSEY